MLHVHRNPHFRGQIRFHHLSLVRNHYKVGFVVLSGSSAPNLLINTSWALFSPHATSANFRLMFIGRGSTGRVRPLRSVSFCW